MSQPRGFSQNGKSYYSNVTTPQDINLQFTVLATNGLGVSSVKSNGYVRNVFMHTSTTPTANDGYTNPNPANGYFAIQFNNNFNYYLSNFWSVRAPGSGSDVKIDNSAMTSNLVYIITTLGDATAAKWLAIGVPPGVTPAVGVSFVAASNGGAGNVLTSRVQVAASPNIYGIEMVGNPGVMLSSSNIGTNGGAWLLGRFVAPTFTAGAYTPVGTVSAPTFTGSALGNHAHDFLVKGGQAGSTTNDIAAYAGPLIGKEQASDATFAGGSSSLGGVQNASAGTPAGTNSAPTFTGSAASLTGTLAFGAVAPTAGSVVSMLLKYDGSSVTIDGI